jgi:CheY-like chemotaxis protein
MLINILNSLTCSGINAILSLFSARHDIMVKGGMFMKDIIDWLLRTEEAARQIYSTAAAFFLEDKSFSEFLKTLAEDEALHVRIMKIAHELYRKETDPIGDAILLDPDTKSKIDGHIESLQKIIESGNLNKKAMIDYIICVEHSEWNPIFLFVVNTLKHECSEFSTVGPKLQHHLRSIDQYLETTGEKIASSEALLSLKPVWDEGILIVDDAPEITELLSELLNQTGNVETAPNGAEALKKAIHHYYAVIVSDINMPVMNGIDFLTNLESFYKDVAERFIFMTGYPEPEVVTFCRIKNIPLLRKPFGLNELNDFVYKILENKIRRQPLRELIGR